MRHLGLFVRVVLLLAVFAGVGLLTSHLVVARAVARGAPEYTVRLAGYMAGLFVGGAAATITGIAILLFRRTAVHDETRL